MRSRIALGFSLLFFVSGATGLVYELLWVRVLYQTFGSTIQSVTTVVAAYMGGLGLGAWLLGRYADRHARPAALYGVLEIAIGLFGAISPLVLALAHRVYVGLAGPSGLGSAGGIALRFGLAALVLLVPTTLMGGTLPVLTRAFMGDERARLRASLGWLYGLNTLGAVLGTALAGFYLIEYAGVRATLWVTAAVNLAVGGAALALARPLAPAPIEGIARPAAPAHAALRTAGLILLAVTAFASLLDEIAWTRLFVMFVGGSTYAFTLVLLVFLLGIGLGSALVARGAEAPADSAAAAGLAQGLTAGGVALLFLFLGALPVYVIALFQVLFLTAAQRLALMGVAIGAVMLPPAIGMGMTLPLLSDLVARSDGARGADVGRAYALNTIGAIVGATVTGFALVSTLGLDLTLRLGLGVSALAAIALVALAARGVPEGSREHARLRIRVLGGGILATFGLVVAVAAPRWSTRLIDLGPTIYARTPIWAAGLRDFLDRRGQRQLAYRDGRNATVSVWESQAGRSLKVNGKTDASDYGDMDTQIMAGLAPAAARPHARAALVIGYGSGVTTRVLASVPGMERVEVVEIEPAVIAMDRFFHPVNDSVLGRASVSVILDDARSALQLRRDRFDVIASEPSNPWVAGIATLYTPDFYRIVRSRLAADGVFCQWVQLYQLPLSVVAGIVRNVRTVFPHVEVWFGSLQDIMVVGALQPIRYDDAWLARLVGPAGAIGGLGRDWLGIEAPRDYFGRRLLGDSGVARLVRQPTIVHTDDRPRLEYVSARRFLDSEGMAGVLDSLVAFGRADGGSPLLLARALGARRTDATGLRYIDAVRRERPREPEWTVRTAAIRLAQGDTTFADTALARVRGQARDAEALLWGGLIAGARGQPAPARSLLEAALAAGGDTAAARAMLGALAAREARWAQAGAHVRAALRGGPWTFRRPFPHAGLEEALSTLASSGPPALADSLLATALAQRAGVARLYDLRAIAALRMGRCAEAARNFVTLLEFGIDRAGGPEFVERCRGGWRP